MIGALFQAAVKITGVNKFETLNTITSTQEFSIKASHCKDGLLFCNPGLGKYLRTLACV